MPKTPEKMHIIKESRRISVSSQGQVALPKALREQLGDKANKATHINILVKSDDLVTIDQEPTVNQLFGILKTGTGMKPANMYELREDMANKRNRQHGYNSKE